MQLAPSYDARIVSGLVEANVETLALMSSVSNDAVYGTFSKRENTYNNIIRRFKKLQSQVAARPDPGSSKAPSEDIIKEIVSVIIMMKNTDKKGTLTKEKVEKLFLISYTTSFEQVFTYEKALER